MAYSISLNYLNEGPQAEEYKAKKAFEQKKAEHIERNKYGAPGDPGVARRAQKSKKDDNVVSNNAKPNYITGNKGDKKEIKHDKGIAKDAWKMAQKATGIKDPNKASEEEYYEFQKAADAARKHLRKNESFSLFESVNFI